MKKESYFALTKYLSLRKISTASFELTSSDIECFQPSNLAQTFKKAREPYVRSLVFDDPADIDKASDCVCRELGLGSLLNILFLSVRNEPDVWPT